MAEVTPRDHRGTRRRAGGELELTVAHHGPVVLGDPRRGRRGRVRYTATAHPNRTFEALVPMLRSASADDLEAASAPRWIRQQSRLRRHPRRPSGIARAGACPSAPTRTPGSRSRAGTASRVAGAIPFEAMPALRDPAVGSIATANSRIEGAGTRTI